MNLNSNPLKVSRSSKLVALNLAAKDYDLAERFTSLGFGPAVSPVHVGGHSRHLSGRRHLDR